MGRVTMPMRRIRFLLPVRPRGRRRRIAACFAGAFCRGLGSAGLLLALTCFLVLPLAGCAAPPEFGAPAGPALPTARGRSPSSALPPAAVPAPLGAGRPEAAAQPAPPGQAAELADRIAGAKGLEEGGAAVRTALAKGGIATADGGARAVAPAAPILAAPAEIALLTIEARRSGAAPRLNAEQLGRALRGLGFPFAAGAAPGERIVRFLSARVRGAERAPADPRGFVWLFLSETGKRKSPPIDLAGGAASPEEVHFNLLELQLFAASFLRGALLTELPAADSQLAMLDAVTDSGPVAAYALSAPAPALAQAGPKPPRADACTAILDRLMPPRPGTEGARRFGDDLVGTAAKEAIEELMGLGLSEANREALGDATNALTILLRAQKLVALGSWTELMVSASEASVHKPEKDAPSKLVTFTARAGVSEAEWSALQKIGAALPAADRFDKDLKDCMALVGPGMYTDIEALAKEAETWNVAWELRPKTSPHVQIKLGGTHPAPDENVFDFPGLRQSKLQRGSGASAATELRLVVLPEDVKGHRGRAMTAYVDVCARLKTEKLPSLGVLVDAAGGGVGLASALFELTSAFWRTFDPRTTCATLEVTYHEAAHGYRFRGLNVRTEEWWSIFGRPWELQHRYETSVSGETCGDDPYGVWGIDFTQQVTRPDGSSWPVTGGVGADLARRWGWYMKARPDGVFAKDPTVYSAVGTLRLVAGAREIEMATDEGMSPYSRSLPPAFVKRFVELDNPAARAAVEEVWDCESDSDDVIRSFVNAR
jgi:hypothetical protein